MATFHHRGMMLESMINKTIAHYRTQNLALIHKKSVPISFNKLGSNHALALEKSWISGVSEADYYGLYQGRFIAFEAKSTRSKSLPLANIKAHQIAYLREVARLGGMAFLLIYFALTDQCFYLTLSALDQVSTKSLSLAFVQKNGVLLELQYPGYIDFLPALATKH